MASNLPKSVKEAGQLKIRGPRLDDGWFKHICFDNGKPYMLAILILSELYYWYTPSEVKDEDSGNLIGEKKKFKADKLQRSFQALADRFGFSKRQATDACHFLREKNLITIEYRTLRLGEVVLNNVTFFEPIIENIKRISSMYQVEEETSERDTLPRLDVRGSNIQMGDLSHLNVTPPTLGCETYTLTTTVTSTGLDTDTNNGVGEELEIDIPDEFLIGFRNAPVDPGLGRFATLYEGEIGRPMTRIECDGIKEIYDLVGEELAMEALKRAVKAETRQIRYIETIAREWRMKGIKSLIGLQAADKKFNDIKLKNGQGNKMPKHGPETSKEPNKYEKFYL